MPLLEQLKRRNVFRVGTAYLAMSWLLVQIAETLFPVFEIGPGTIRTLVVVLAIGFVPVLILSWLFEITPDGIRREEDVDHDQAASARQRERLNQVVIVSLVLAVSYFAIDKFVWSEAVPEAVADEVAVAVLPFSNLSDAEDMAFFSDGVAEDILGLLSQVEGLRCIARSSSFALRDPGLAAGEIGERLGVTHVLTGSLRSHGQKIRVSVRLVETATELLVWSNSYDRHLDDVFAIQDDISRHVVASIAPALTSGLSSAEVPDDTMSYINYLRARHTYLQGRDNRDVDRVLKAKALYEDLLASNPGYARAYAGLADVWSQLSIMAEVHLSEGYPRAREYAERALEIDPGIAEAWYALGDILVEYYWDLPAADVAYGRATELAPQDADGLRGYAYFLRSVGKTDAAVEVYKKTLQLDPFSQRGLGGLYRTLVSAGRFEEAEDLMRSSAPSGTPPEVIEGILLPLYEARGDLDRIQHAFSSTGPVMGRAWFVYFTAVVQRHEGDVEAANETIQTILDMEITGGLPLNWLIARFHALFGDFDLALEFLDKAAAAQEIGLAEALQDRNFAELRNDPRFWDWVSRSGIKPLE